MNDSGSNEFHDPELSRSLGRLSGAYPDDAVAYGQVHQRVKQVRRRRAAAWSSGALVAVVAVGAVALGTQRGGRTLEPADRPDLVTDTRNDDMSTVPTVPVTPAPTMTVMTVTSPPQTTEAAIEADDGPANTEGGGPVVPVPASANSGSPTTVRSSGSKPSKPPTSTIPGTQPPATSAPAPSTTEADDDDDGEDGSSFTPQTQSFSGLGGSVTVSMDGDGDLRMLSYTATAGYAADDIENGSERVSIRFRNGSLSTRIRVVVAGDTMTPTVVEED